MASILSILASFLIAVLSGLGVGSGGLLVIWLTEVCGVSPVQARATNLLFFVFSATSALLFHLKRRKINLGLSMFLSAFALLGTILGSLFGAFVTPLLLRRIFGGMLVFSGIYTLIAKKE